MRDSLRSIALLVLGLLLGAGMTVTAQMSKVTAVPPPPAGGVSADAAQIVTSSDLALRIDGRRDGKVVGTLMMKSGEEWVEVQIGSTATMPQLP